MQLATIQKTLLKGWCDGWRPKKRVRVVEWADTFRVLPAKGSAEPGRYRSSRTPYMREIMDCLSYDSPIKRVVVMAGAQVAKTETGNNWLGSIISHDPGPVLVVMPTIVLAERWSKQKLEPMIRDTPILAELIPPSRARDSGNSVLSKEFPDGMVLAAGANSAASLRSTSVRFLFLDEVDTYPQDVEGEGNPVDLAEQRTNTFTGNKKVLLTSTPTIKGHSHIEGEIEKTDYCHYYVPCPECGHMDWIRWANIKWIDDNPKTAKLQCEDCGCLIDEHNKTKMLKHGEWRASQPDKADGVTRGFHLSGLYSPVGWRSWEMCVRDWINSKNDIPKRITFINTVLAETWEETVDIIDSTMLKSHCHSYGEGVLVPEGARVLVASVDVQDNRLEAQIKAYGRGEESWLINHSVFVGSPGEQATWDELTEYLEETYTRADGATTKIAATAIDMGGHHTDMVYKYAQVMSHRNVFAVQGKQLAGKEIISKATRNNKYRAPLCSVGTDAAKERVMYRLKVEMPGPGYMHFPEETEQEYLEQMTAERPIRKYVKGKGTVRTWVKRRDRNEAWDLEVYCLAAFYSLGPVKVAQIASDEGPKKSYFTPSSKAPVAVKEDPMASLATPKPPPKANKWAIGGHGSGWVNKWK